MTAGDSSSATRQILPHDVNFSLPVWSLVRVHAASCFKLAGSERSGSGSARATSYLPVDDKSVGSRFTLSSHRSRSSRAAATRDRKAAHEQEASGDISHVRRANET